MSAEIELFVAERANTPPQYDNSTTDADGSKPPDRVDGRRRIIFAETIS
jgi:hypothetical protein